MRLKTCFVHKYHILTITIVSNVTYILVTLYSYWRLILSIDFIVTQKLSNSRINTWEVENWRTVRKFSLYVIVLKCKYMLNLMGFIVYIYDSCFFAY
jgi:hypothetical protein